MATWYKAGTIDVTNGSTIITGTGTAFVANLQAGDELHAPDGKLYEITQVVSDVSFIIVSSYLGSTATTQTYSIQPTRGWTKRVMDELDASNTDVTTMLAGPGAGKFPDGTLAQPGMRFSADEDTGVRRVGSNAVALVAGGADKLSVTGNVASGDAVQSTSTDTTVGKLMTVGAFGLGVTNASTELVPADDLDALITQGFWRYSSTATGSPSIAAGSLLHLTRLAASFTQIAFERLGDVYHRNYTSGAWTPWIKQVDFESNGDLNINADTLFVDASVSKVGMGNTAPEEKLHITGNVLLENAMAIKWHDAAGTAKTVMRVDAADQVTIRGAGGTKALEVEDSAGSAVFTVGDDGDIGLGAPPGTSRLTAKTTADQTIILANSTNATFTQQGFSVNVARAASSAYKFFDAYSGDFGDLEFRLSGDGNGSCDGSWTGGGADYAEYFEWADGNPLAEDRRGISVVLIGDQIREAVAGETPIGVISGNPSVIGDAAPFRWKGKYQRDDFGGTISEDYEAVSWIETVTETVIETEQATEVQEYTETVVTITNGAAVQATVTKTRDVPLFDEYPLTDATGNDLGIHREPRMIEVTRETTKEVEHSYAMDQVPVGITVPADASRVTQTRRKLNPDYVEGTDYTPREDRPEWDTVGLMGKLRLRTGQATGAGWVQMRDVSADVEEWLVR